MTSSGRHPVDIFAPLFAVIPKIYFEVPNLPLAPHFCCLQALECGIDDLSNTLDQFMLEANFIIHCPTEGNKSGNSNPTTVFPESYSSISPNLKTLHTLTCKLTSVTKKRPRWSWQGWTLSDLLTFSNPLSQVTQDPWKSSPYCRLINGQMNPRKRD